MRDMAEIESHISGQLKAHGSSSSLTFEMWTDEGGQSGRWFIENG